MTRKHYWGVYIRGTIDLDSWFYYPGMMMYISQLESGWSDKNMIMVF